MNEEDRPSSFLVHHSSFGGCYGESTRARYRCGHAAGDTDGGV